MRRRVCAFWILGTVLGWYGWIAGWHANAESVERNQWLNFRLSDFAPSDWPSVRNVQAERAVLEYEFEKLGIYDAGSIGEYAVVWDAEGVCEIEPSELPHGIPTVHIRTGESLELTIHAYALLLEGATVLHLIDGPPSLLADKIKLLAHRKVIHGYTCGRVLSDRRFLYEQEWEFLFTPPGFQHVKPSLSHHVFWPHMLRTMTSAEQTTGESSFSLSMRAVTLPAQGILLEVLVNGDFRLEISVVDLCTQDSTGQKGDIPVDVNNLSCPRVPQPQACERFRAQSVTRGSDKPVHLSSPMHSTRCELADGSIRPYSNEGPCEVSVPGCAWRFQHGSLVLESTQPKGLDPTHWHQPRISSLGYYRLSVPPLASRSLISDRGVDLSGCTHFFLDVGTNIGVSIRKLFEPHRYPGAPFLAIFDQVFPQNRNKLESLCAIGIEMNPAHTSRLSALMQHYSAVCGYKVHIFTETAAAAHDGDIEFYTLLPDQKEDDLELGASIYQWMGSAAAQPIRVRAMDLSKFVLNQIVPHASTILMKLDIEGSEATVVPHLLATGALCAMDRVLVEVHPRMMRPDQYALLNSTMHLLPQLSASGCKAHVTHFDDEKYAHDGYANGTYNTC